MTTVKSTAKRKSTQRPRPVFATKAQARGAEARTVSKSVMGRTKKARAYLAK